MSDLAGHILTAILFQHQLAVNACTKYWTNIGDFYKKKILNETWLADLKLIVIYVYRDI